MGRAGGGKEGRANAESRRTWHSDSAALGAMPRFWRDPVPSPSHGHLGCTEGPGARGSTRCGSYGDFYQTLVRDILSLSHSQRREEGRVVLGPSCDSCLGVAPRRDPAGQ